MKLQVLESQTPQNPDRTDSAAPIKTKGLTAKWLIVNDRLVCKWVIE